MVARESYSRNVTRSWIRGQIQRIAPFNFNKISAFNSTAEDGTGRVGVCVKVSYPVNGISQQFPNCMGFCRRSSRQTYMPDLFQLAFTNRVNAGVYDRQKTFDLALRLT